MITEQEISQFKKYLCEDEKSALTIEKYIRDIFNFSVWLSERELCKTEVLEYKEYLKNKMAVSSVNSIISAMNSYFKFIERHDLHIKTMKTQKQIFSKSERELTKPEYDRLVRAAERTGNIRLKLILQTFGSTGIRVSELQYITVEAAKKETAVIHCKNKTRMIFLPAKLCKMILKYAKDHGIKSGSIFITKNGNPLNRSNIWSAMKRLCSIAGVLSEKVFPHNLRHLFARTYYAIYKDIVRLADILGHSSVNTTRIYTIETGEIHRRQIQKIGLLQI